MKKKIGLVFIIIGALCLAGALGFAYYNQWQNNRAEKSSERLAEQFAELVTVKNDEKSPEETQDDNEGDASEKTETDKSDIPDYADGDRDGSTAFGSDYVATDDGYNLYGYIIIDSIGVELPVLADYSESLLNIAPCRYTEAGTPDDKLVIAGHNFNCHFGHLADVAIGDRVEFVNCAGVRSIYKVVSEDTIEANDFMPLIEGEWDLGLFTCNFSGAKRVLIRCSRIG